MKFLVFDSGPIISLTTNNLLWLLEPLKQKFDGEFFITESVKRELVDRPLSIKKFKFEAFQVQQQIESKILIVTETDEIKRKAQELLDIANNTFFINDVPMRIVQLGEMESIAAALVWRAEAVVIDERTTRMLIENPSGLEKLFEQRLHEDVKVNKQNLDRFDQMTNGLKIIRSVELVAAAYELGLLEKYAVHLPNAKRELLDSVLWGVKLHGCAVSGKEISEIIRLAKL